MRVEVVIVVAWRMARSGGVEDTLKNARRPLTEKRNRTRKYESANPSTAIGIKV